MIDTGRYAKGFSTSLHYLWESFNRHNLCVTTSCVFITHWKLLHSLNMKDFISNSSEVKSFVFTTI